MRRPGEINSTVDDQAARMAAIRPTFGDGAEIDELDGLTVTLAGRQLVQRPGVQHRAAAAAERRGEPSRTMVELRDAVLAVIRG